MADNQAVANPEAVNQLIGLTHVCADTNPVRFSNKWTGFPDPIKNGAEISNDTDGYKTLMIVGNNSAGLGRRVSVWDRLEVNGVLSVTKDTSIGGNLTVAGLRVTGPLTLPSDITVSGLLPPAPAGGDYDNVVMDKKTGKLYYRD